MAVCSSALTLAGGAGPLSAMPGGIPRGGGTTGRACPAWQRRVPSPKRSTLEFDGAAGREASQAHPAFMAGEGEEKQGDDSGPPKPLAEALQRLVMGSGACCSGCMHSHVAAATKQAASCALMLTSPPCVVLLLQTRRHATCLAAWTRCSGATRSGRRSRWCSSTTTRWRCVPRRPQVPVSGQSHTAVCRSCRRARSMRPRQLTKSARSHTRCLPGTFTVRGGCLGQCCVV